MTEETNSGVNIFPFDRSFRRKSSFLKQKGIVIWLFGLSGAGKSTLASLLEQRLAEDHFFTVLLDGDNLRNGINKDLTFSEVDRLENIRRVAEIASIMVRNDIIVICSFITPLREHRDLAGEILSDYYFEVFVDCPLAVCEARDVKGLYKKAREQKIPDFTGISSPFEPSKDADLILATSEQTPQQSAEALYQKVVQLVRI